MTASPRILFAGGGTGGHVFPAVAVAQAVLARDPSAQLLFALPQGRENYLKGTPWEGKTVTVAAPRFDHLKRPGRILGLAWNGTRGMISSARLLASFRPQAILGTGGYASAPVVLSAGLCGIPVILLEPNAVAGKANRFLSRWAETVASAWEFDYEPWAERRHPFSTTTRLEITGTPVRAEILAAAGEPERPGVLVYGGSQGASLLNRTASEALVAVGRAFPGLVIRHLTGLQDVDAISARYREAGIPAEVLPFLYDMRQAYREASVIVCRAGANSLAEVLSLGKAAVLVPLPTSADGHQKANALQASRRGAAVLLEEAEMTPARLAAEISRLLGDATARAEMGRRARALGRPQAADTVAMRLLSLAQRKRAHAA